MNQETISTLVATISTLVSAIISGIISYAVCRWQLAKQRIENEESRLNEHLANIINIQIEYPYLENQRFCDSWDSTKVSEDNYQRYDSYCCLVFNFLSQIFDLYKGNTEQIQNFFAVEEMIIRHKKWWQKPINPRDNIDGYNYPFRNFLNSFINKE